MAASFLYDTHYQVDKPFALIDVTIATASPSATTPDHILAKRLEEQAKSRKVRFLGSDSAKKWKINKDAFIYWIGNCQQAALLSRQNAYDYWLMNFVWAGTFPKTSDAWGSLSPSAERVSKLLLFRLAWLFDAPMLAALLWQLSQTERKTKRILLEEETKTTEEMVVSVLGVLREATQDVRLRTDYRKQIEDITRRGLKYNTRRHKLATHLSLLLEPGVISDVEDAYRLPDGLRGTLAQYGSAKDAAYHALLPSLIGPGGKLFLELATSAFQVTPTEISDLTAEEWPGVLKRIQSIWSTIELWDRKFLGIDALAELFLVDNLARGTQLWASESWKRFLLDRSRHHPDEVTIHVGRFGEVQYLRLP